MSNTMKAMVLTGHGGLDKYVWHEDWPKPAPGPMEALDLRTFYLRDLTFTGSTIIPLAVFNNLVGYIERAEIKPVLAATYPLSELREAQQAFINKQHTGNIVVLP